MSDKDHSSVELAVGPAASEAWQCEAPFVHSFCGKGATSNTSAAATAVPACKVAVDPHSKEARKHISVPIGE